MSRAPKVSVIIPCFNHGEFLAEAVASVSSMNRDDVELIVVDDGSTDERTIKEMDALSASGIHVIRQENKGLAAARNAGVRASKGEYIFPLDADDRVRPGYIEHGIRILDDKPEVGVVYADAQLFGTTSDCWIVGPFNPRRLLEKNCIAASAVFRRSVWEQNGGYDERMLDGFEDWDFWIGAYEHGWQFAYVPQALFEYRKAEVSMLTRVGSLEGRAAQYVAAKHAALYRQSWLELANERDSCRATFRNLRRIVKTRIKQKLRIDGDHG
jgi:glycosyltransferase involved in cell wall biosynthesis